VVILVIYFAKFSQLYIVFKVKRHTFFVAISLLIYTYFLELVMNEGSTVDKADHWLTWPCRPSDLANVLVYVTSQDCWVRSKQWSKIFLKKGFLPGWLPVALNCDNWLHQPICQLICIRSKCWCCCFRARQSQAYFIGNRCCIIAYLPFLVIEQYHNINEARWQEWRLKKM